LHDRQPPGYCVGERVAVPCLGLAGTALALVRTSGGVRTVIVGHDAASGGSRDGITLDAAGARAGAITP
jgi:hypothetical protein